MGPINWHTVFFLLYALLACGFAVAVVVSTNIVRMALCLIVSLGATSGLFFLAGADFVGAMQLMIYVGGTLVLLIFGVMLTAQGPFISMKTGGGDWIVAVLLSGCLAALLVPAAFSVKSWRNQPASIAAATEGRRVEFVTPPPQNIPQGGSFGLRAAAINDKGKVDEFYEGPLTVTLAKNPVAGVLSGEVTKNAVAGIAEFTGLSIDRAARGYTIEVAGGGLPATSAPADVIAVKTATALGLGLLGARVDSLPADQAALRPGMSGYLLPFELVSMHLLVVLVGAAYLARTKRRAKPKGT